MGFLLTSHNNELPVRAFRDRLLAPVLVLGAGRRCWRCAGLCVVPGAGAGCRGCAPGGKDFLFPR